MTVNSRYIGGQNNKQGNRYEDHFSVYRILCHLGLVLFQSMEVRIKEQANCPVDDLVIKTEREDHYHQLKADRSITWGEQGNKLKNEFIQQRKICEKEKRLFRLWVIVADLDREKSLKKDMPDEINGVTTVLLFPRLNRPSDLVKIDLVNNQFEQIRATRFSSRTEHENIIHAIFIAWVEHLPDPEGYCLLSRVVEHIRAKAIGRICLEWSDTTGMWEKCEQILKKIPNLQYWTDKGYFEWSYPPTDHGIAKEDCASDSFQRFMHRILEERPTSFERFEELLP